MFRRIGKDWASNYRVTRDMAGRMRVKFTTETLLGLIPLQF